MHVFTNTLYYLERFTYCSIQDILHESLCRRRAIHP